MQSENTHDASIYMQCKFDLCIVCTIAIVDLCCMVQMEIPRYASRRILEADTTYNTAPTHVGLVGVVKQMNT